MYTKTQIKNILNIALYAGKTMLESGAETYRVEDTIKRICQSKNIMDTEVFVIPTGIFLTVHYNDEVYSYIKRIKSTSIDLHIISLVNDFSRKFVTDDIKIIDSLSHLEQIRYAPKYKILLTCIFGGLSGGFFTLMFGGQIIELVLAFITSFFVILSTKVFKKYNNSYFLVSIIGGIVNTTIAVLLTYGVSHIFYITADFNKIIIGSIMPLVPGVAFTNAIRDSINADFVSGISKLLEAFIIAIGIAIGVGFILNINIHWIGGVF